MITIFSEPPQSTAYPTTFVVSILVHGSLLGLLTFNVVQSHRIIERFPETRYALRVVDFHSKEPQSRQSAGGGIVYRGPQPAPRKLAQGGSSGGSPTITRQTAELMPAPQTLVQPDLPKETIVSPKIPVPMVVLWTPDKVAPKKIVPALPEQPTISVVHPSLDTPIKEETVADLRISSTRLPRRSPAPLLRLSSMDLKKPGRCRRPPLNNPSYPRRPECFLFLTSVWSRAASPFPKPIKASPNPRQAPWSPGNSKIHRILPMATPPAIRRRRELVKDRASAPATKPPEAEPPRWATVTRQAKTANPGPRKVLPITVKSQQAQEARLRAVPHLGKHKEQPPVLDRGINLLRFTLACPEMASLASWSSDPPSKSDFQRQQNCGAAEWHPLSTCT